LAYLLDLPNIYIINNKKAPKPWTATRLCI